MEKKNIDPDAVVYHIHHQQNDNEGYRREISINGAVYSISLCSDYPEEDIDFLAKKSMEILKQLIMERN